MPTLLLVLVDRVQIRIPLIPVGKRFFKKSVTKNFNSGFLSCFTPLVSAVRAAVVRATRARWAAPGATTLACGHPSRHRRRGTLATHSASSTVLRPCAYAKMCCTSFPWKPPRSGSFDRRCSAAAAVASVIMREQCQFWGAARGAFPAQG